VSEYLLVSPEHFARQRMAKLFALSEDRELLTRLRAPLLSEVEIEGAPLEADHQPFERIERPDEVLRHEPEGRAAPVRHSGDRARSPREHAENDEGAGRSGSPAQIATEGWWTPKTPRRRSQISPSVTPAATAVTRSGRRLARPRAAVSSASRARRASSRS